MIQIDLAKVFTLANFPQPTRLKNKIENKMQNKYVSINFKNFSPTLDRPKCIGKLLCVSVNEHLVPYHFQKCQFYIRQEQVYPFSARVKIKSLLKTRN